MKVYFPAVTIRLRRHRTATLRPYRRQHGIDVPYIPIRAPPSNSHRTEIRAGWFRPSLDQARSAECSAVRKYVLPESEALACDRMIHGLILQERQALC